MMDKLFKTIVMIAAAMIICSCCRKHVAMGQPDTATQSAVNETSLLNHAWILIELNEQPVQTDTGSKSPYIMLKMNKVSGNGGCNSFSGNYTLDGKILRFSDFISTKMACDKLDTEYKFLNALKQCYSFQIINDTLVLSDGQNQKIALFKAKSQ